MMGERASKLGCKKVLIVTDKSLTSIGLLSDCFKSLQDQGTPFITFDRCEPDAPIKIIRECIGVARNEGCDLIIGVGGGSVMDTAKIASTLVSVQGDIRESLLHAKDKTAIKNRLPLILVPTTAGTGSEWGRGAIFKDDTTGEKDAFHHEKLYVDEVIIDPQLTFTLPSRITADTGMDALCHAIETYTALNATIMSDMFTEKAITLVSNNLRLAYTSKHAQPEARNSLALAASLALGAGRLTGTNMTNAMLAHAMAYPLQDMASPPVSHGVSVCILLPHVMEFNCIANLTKFSHIARLMGKRIDHLDPREAALKSVEAVRDISIDVGMPQQMRNAGIKKEFIPQMVESVCTRRSIHTENNCRRASREDVARIFGAAW